MSQYEQQGNPLVTARANPRAHLSWLEQASTKMRHIDEVFLWLAQTMIQHFDIQAVQFWTPAVSTAGQTTVQQRMVVCQGSVVPVRVVSNEHTAATVQFLLKEKIGVNVQVVDHKFSGYQVTLLKRYGLLYWFAAFIRDDALLPPSNSPAGTNQIAVPLELITLMFFRRPPSQHLVTTTNLWVKQALLIAKKRGLLVTSTAAARPVTQPAFSLNNLIPRRFQEASMMRLHSPFASLPTISDANARILYQAIDGRKSVAELASMTGLDEADIFAALSTLLDQQHIVLYGPDGQFVQNASMLKLL